MPCAEAGSKKKSPTPRRNVNIQPPACLETTRTEKVPLFPTMIPEYLHSQDTETLSS